MTSEAVEEMLCSDNQTRKTAKLMRTKIFLFKFVLFLLGTIVGNWKWRRRKMDVEILAKK